MMVMICKRFPAAPAARCIVNVKKNVEARGSWFARMVAIEDGFRPISSNADINPEDSVTIRNEFYRELMTSESLVVRNTHSMDSRRQGRWCIESSETARR